MEHFMVIYILEVFTVLTHFTQLLAIFIVPFLQTGNKLKNQQDLSSK